METREVLRTVHAGPRTLERGVCDGLSVEQMLERPEGMNSVAWLVWHMARCEDVAINTVVRGEPQVLEDGWWDRVGVTARHVSTETSDEELRQFDANVDVAALRAYRDAVADQTAAWLKECDPATLPDDARSTARLESAPDSLAERAEWVREQWSGQTRLWFVTWLSAGHHYTHLGEAQVTRERLGEGLRFA
jgi:hypothetical protein